jgi:hypothetical protein
MNIIIYEYEINYLFNLLISYNDLHNLNIINKDMYTLLQMDSDTETSVSFTYSDIIKTRKDKSIKQLEDCLIDLEKEREIIEKNITFLWEKVMEPYINFKADLILTNNINNIKLNFYKLLYHNSDIESKIINVNIMIEEQYLILSKSN